MNPTPNPFAGIGPGFHFVHAHGPDGPCVLIIRWHQWGERAEILDDGDRMDAPEQRDDGSWRLHKWRVYRVDPLVRPDFDLSLLDED